LDGCRPFICNTSELHSNCFERFKRTKTSDVNYMNSKSADEKKRSCSCDEEHCTFIGSYYGLQTHAQLDHHNVLDQIDDVINNF